MKGVALFASLTLGSEGGDIVKLGTICIISIFPMSTSDILLDIFNSVK